MIRRAPGGLTRLSRDLTVVAGRALWRMSPLIACCFGMARPPLTSLGAPFRSGAMLHRAGHGWIKVTSCRGERRDRTRNRCPDRDSQARTQNRDSERERGAGTQSQGAESGLRTRAPNRDSEPGLGTRARIGTRISAWNRQWSRVRNRAEWPAVRKHGPGTDRGLKNRWVAQDSGQNRDDARQAHGNTGRATLTRSRARAIRSRGEGDAEPGEGDAQPGGSDGTGPGTQARAQERRRGARIETNQDAGAHIGLVIEH